MDKYFKVEKEEGRASVYLLLGNIKGAETGLWIKNAEEDIPQIIKVLQDYMNNLKL